VSPSGDRFAPGYSGDANPPRSVADIFYRTAPPRTMRPAKEYTLAPASPTRPAMMKMLPPAGMSLTLRNTLEFPSYQESPCIYDAKDALYREPKVGNALFSARASSIPPHTPRVDPRKRQAGGRLPAPKKINETYFGTFLGGKRMIPENPQNLSTVDTVIWGKDWDLSNKFWTRGTAWLDTSMFKHAAGKPTSDIIHLPPVCNQTFGESVPENDTGYHYSGASYGRHAFSAVR
jgi:hypothetical protein